MALRGVALMAIAALLFIAGSLLDGAELAVTLPAMVLVGLGGGVALNISTTVLQEHNGTYGPAMLSLGNAAAAGVGLITPLAIGAATAAGWTWRAAMVLVMPFAVTAWILISRQRAFRPTPRCRWAPSGSASAACPGVLAGRGGGRRRGGHRILHGDLDPGPAGRPHRDEPGYRQRCRFRGGRRNGLGRLLVGFLARDRSPLGLFLVSVGVTAAGWLLVWLVTSTVAAVVGLLVVGLGIAGQYPLGAAMVMALSGGQPDRAIAVMSIGVGFASGRPFVLGALADKLGVQLAFLVVPVLCVCCRCRFIAGQRWGRRALLNASRSISGRQSHRRPGRRLGADALPE